MYFECQTWCSNFEWTLLWRGPSRRRQWQVLFCMLTFFHFPSSSSFLFLGPDVLTKESLTIPWGMQHRFLHQIRTLQFHYSSFSKVFSKFEYAEKDTKIWKKKSRPSPDESNIVFLHLIRTLQYHYLFFLLQCLFKKPAF